MQQGSETLSLEQAMRIVRRRVPLIVLCVVVVAGAALVYSKHQTKMYTATASLAFSYDPLSQQIAGLQGPSVNQLAQQASNLELVKLGDLAAKTASALGDGLTPEKVSEGLSISGQGESSVVDVSSTNASPVLAADIANVYTREFVREQQSSNRQSLKVELALVNKQLAALSPAQRVGADGLTLQQKAQTLRLLAGLGYGNVQVAGEAIAPAAPSSPKTSRNTELGVLLGLLIGLGLALLLERLDRAIKGPRDLEEIYRVPLLGVAPSSGTLARAGRRPLGSDEAVPVLPSAEAEAFNLIRAHLRFFNVDRSLCTVLVGSPTSADGKTTIARRLAEASARVGARVLLLEADLREPTLAKELGLGAASGLADVLIDALPAESAIQSIDLLSPDGRGSTARTLDVLVAGSVRPPNPAELIESHAMAALLERVESAYDLVVVDTPPLAAVSDAIPLLTKVDGVVIVGWVGRSRRDAAERLHRVLDGSGARVLGVIANGVKAGRATSYGGDRPSSTDASAGRVSFPG